MPTISLAIVVKNEELNLRRCLDSVKFFVDEMVLLDTGSTDKTVAIAEELGAKIHHFKWCNNFAIARNHLMQFVSGDWVLVLDADEVFNAEVLPQIKEAIAKEKNLLVNLVRQEVGAAQSPYSLVSRLFRRHPQVQFARPYHGIIDDSVEVLLKDEPHWKIVELPTIAIWHYGYQTQAIVSGDKFTKARQIMEGFYKDNPNDPYVCSKLGALYVQIGQVKRGLKLLEKGLKSKELASPIKYELHYHLANAYRTEGSLGEATKHYQMAIFQPILPLLKVGAYNNFAGLLKDAGNLENAQQLFEQVLQIDPTFAMGYYNLGMVLKGQGKLKEAIAAYEKAIKLQSDYAEAYQNLGVVYLKLGQVEYSIAAFKEAIALHEKKNPKEAERLKQGLIEMGLF